MQTLTIDIESLFNYLVIDVEGELVGCMMNLKERNESYMKTFEQIKKVDDPTNIVLTFSDIEFKMIVEAVTPYSKESLEQTELKCYTKSEVIEKYPYWFEEE